MENHRLEKLGNEDGEEVNEPPTIRAKATLGIKKRCKGLLPGNITSPVGEGIDKAQLAALGLIVMFAVTLTLITAAGPAAAKTTNPNTNVPSNYTNTLANLQGLALITAKWMGLIFGLVGAIMWFSGSSSSSRKQHGVWLVVGGMALIFLFYGWEMIAALIKWTAGG